MNIYLWASEAILSSILGGREVSTSSSSNKRVASKQYKVGSSSSTSAHELPVTYRKSSAGMILGYDDPRCRTSSLGKVRFN
jgi:hypothetical protein